MTPQEPNPAPLPVTQAGITAAVAWVIVQLCAFVPSFAQYQATLISIGGTVVALVFLIVNLFHHKISAAHTPVPNTQVRATVLRQQIRAAGMEPEA